MALEHGHRDGHDPDDHRAHHGRGHRRPRGDVRRRAHGRGARDREAVPRGPRPARDGPPPAPPRRVLHRLRDERPAARSRRDRDGLPDAAGKALGRTVASLLGGAVRDGVDVASYLFYRYPSADGKLPAVDSAEAILDRANELVERNGHQVHKLKGGVLPPMEEYRALRLLRDRFPDDPLVWDPNAAWSVETTIRVGRRLDRGRVRAAMAGGPLQLARGHGPGPRRDRHPVRHEHVPHRSGPARPGDPGTERGRDPRRRALLGRLPGEPGDGRGLQGVQPGRGHAQRPRARHLDGRDGPPGLRACRTWAMPSTATTTTRSTTSSRRPGRIATAGSSLPTAPGWASSSTARSSTITTATSSRTSRSTSSTTPTAPPGCRRSRCSDGGVDPPRDAQPALLPAGRSLEGTAAAGRGRAARPGAGRHRAPGGQPLDRPGPRPRGRRRPGARVPGLPRVEHDPAALSTPLGWGGAAGPAAAQARSASTRCGG